MRYTLTLLILITFLAACNNTIKEEEKFDNGNIKTEKYFEENEGEKELVKEVHYHPNGKKYIEGSYKNNKREGYWASWYDNGQLWSEGNFKDGVSEGKRTVYHQNGKLYYEGSFEKGNRIGVWKFYDDNGKLVNEIDYSTTPAPGKE